MDIKFGKVYKGKVSYAKIIPVELKDNKVMVQYIFSYSDSPALSYIGINEMEWFVPDVKKVVDCKIARVLYKDRKFEEEDGYLVLYKESFYE